MSKKSVHVDRPILWLSVVLVLAMAVPRAAQAQPSWTDSARFLEQATFGPTWESIAHVQQIGFEAFLEEQAGLYPWDYDVMDPWPQQRNATFCPNNSACQRDNYTMYPLQKHFFQNALYGADQLRQRMAWALSQILVTSGRDLTLSSWMQPYQQILYSGAFGNYFGLLYNVTVNPGMGNYLDMVNNRCQRRVPNDPAVCLNGQVSKPNENFAREILQLFSIGLYALNPDGTYQRDEGGFLIPSYTQETIEEFSRVFTGWVFAPNIPIPPERGGGTVTNYRDPMIVNVNGAGQQQYHDKGPKTLLNGFVLPGGQTAQDELVGALYNIITHQNAGPFISKQLIQKLVTSNPSPAYVARIVAVFNANLWSDDQLYQVARAILLDPEARDEFPANPHAGHLREPVLFMTTFLRAFYAASFDASTISDGVLNPVNLGGSYQIGSAHLEQDVFRAPTVFNFYSPEFQVPLEEGVLGPEFEIFTSMTALRRSNFVARMVNPNGAMTHGIIPQTSDVLNARPDGTTIDLNGYVEWAADPGSLVGLLSYILLHGTMSFEMYDIITNHVASIPAAQPLQRVRDAVYLIATSPKYQVER